LGGFDFCRSGSIVRVENAKEADQAQAGRDARVIISQNKSSPTGWDALKQSISRRYAGGTFQYLKPLTYIFSFN
jgi:hypothetical protein